MNAIKYFIALLIFCLNIVSFSQWQKITSFPTIYALDVINSSNTFYVITYGNGVYKSTDGTASWQPVNNGLNVNDALRGADIMFSGTNIFIATVDGVYKSTDGAASWVKKSSGIVLGGGANNLFAESVFEDAGVLYTGSYTGIYRSTNNGDNWVVTNISGSAVSAKGFLNYNGILFAARETNNMPGSYKSTDGGVTWSPFAITGTYLPAITFFNDGTRLYSGTIDGVWVSSDNGQNWVSRNTGLSLDPYSSSIIRVNSTLITSLKFGGSGIYRSSNDGLNWENISTGLPFLSSIEKLITYQDKIIAVTSDGLYQRFTSEIVGVESNTQTANEFSLSQNYPNPFNPSTNIEYGVKSHSVNVKLLVYDILGNEILALINRKQNAGTYKVEFDGTDFPSGVYFYQLAVDGSIIDTKKMLMIR
jgi:hypothetical protein